MLLSNISEYNHWLQRTSFYYQYKNKFAVLCLSSFFTKIGKLDKNIANTDIKIKINIAWKTKKWFFKITEQSIKRLIILAKVFYIKLSSCK